LKIGDEDELASGAYTLFQEDCLVTARKLPHGVVDLIYADPPLFTGRSFRTGPKGFDDRWNGLPQYLKWAAPRLREFKRILKLSGTLYLHCDWHASHYLKVLADSIFGYTNFINEIVWRRQSSHNDSRQGSRHFGRVHDSILVYTLSADYVWNQQFTKYDEDYLKRSYRYVEKESGRRYALGDVTAPGGAAKRNARYEFEGIERYWRYSKLRMRELREAGRIVCEKDEVPRLKRYLDEMRGKPVQDVWTDIKPVSTSRQNLHFPTQKPEGLLERIIGISSREGQVVYDPFVGSGTCGAVCYQMARKWIGSETSSHACRVALNRLAALGCEVDISTTVTPLKIRAYTHQSNIG
jgi:DNA modification methylase